MIDKKNIASPTFESLSKNFVCPSYNLTTNKLIYFSNKTTPQMEVKEAVILSCAIPLLFSPCSFNGEKYIDGGIIDNFPVNQTLKLFPSKNAVGIYCQKSYSTDDTGTWGLSDMTKIIFAASLYYTQKQLDEVQDSFELIIINSNTPFYELSLSKDKLIEMYENGKEDKQ
jgi:predicted acylesterase/phospholipase RssA